MRAIEIRMNWARGVVAAAVYDDELPLETLESLEDAVALGHSDCSSGVSYENAPYLLRDVPALLSAWQRGWSEMDCALEQAWGLLQCPDHDG